MPFSPEAQIRALLEDPYVRRALRARTSSKRSRSLGGMGVTLLNQVAYAFIVGLTEPATRLVDLIAEDLRTTSDKAAAEAYSHGITIFHRHSGTTAFPELSRIRSDRNLPIPCASLRPRGHLIPWP